MPQCFFLQQVALQECPNIIGSKAPDLCGLDYFEATEYLVLVSLGLHFLNDGRLEAG